MINLAAEDTKLGRLRNALALNRSIETLASIVREAETTVEHDETKRVSYMTNLLIRSHKENFSDWKEQNVHRPGEMQTGTARDAVRSAILNVLCANGGHGDVPPKGLFDSNGYVIYHEKPHVAEVLGEFYDKMRDAKPFAYGNELTLDFFMVALGKLPAFQEVYPDGIDMRRLDKADIDGLHHGGRKDIVRAMEHALEGTRTPPLKNKANGYGEWGKNVEFVSGIQFLSYKKDDKTFLVTANGGLVPLEKIRGKLEAHLTSDALVADFSPVTKDMVTGYLPGKEVEALRAPDKHFCDGHVVSPEAAPLVCLDVNILTGLRSPAHNVLLGLIEDNCPGKKLFDLAKNVQMKEQLLAAAGTPARRHVVDVAFDHLTRVVEKLDAETDKEFEGKTRNVAHPKVFVCMGGAGSGKTAVEDIAKAQCGIDKNNKPDFVKASLDEFRKRSDLYTVMTAAGHHRDDYNAVEPFASTLRTWVADRAREQKVNILYDGTGVTYQPGYANLVSKFKKAGFHTHVAGVDTPLITPQGKEKEYTRKGAIDTVTDRFGTDNRALPWIVVTGKHTRMPRSFVQAAEDTVLDKLTLFANDKGYQEHYLVAESFVMSDSELLTLRAKQKEGALAAHLGEIMTSHKDAALPQMATQDKPLEKLLGLNPPLKEDNVAFTVYPVKTESGAVSKKSYRVLVVYNTDRYVDLLEKGLQNPHASYKQGLLHTPATVAFDISKRVQEILKGEDAPKLVAV